MLQTRNAIGNLIARYQSVLHHCNVLNARSIKKIASTVVIACFIFCMCGLGTAWGEYLPVGGWDTAAPTVTTKDSDYTNENGSTVTVAPTGILNITGTFTNEGGNAYVDANGTPYWDDASVYIYSNDNGTGTLTADTVDNKDGVLIVSGGTLNATTINNSTQVETVTESDKTTEADDSENTTDLYSTTGSIIWLNGGTIGTTETIINNSGTFLVDAGTVNAIEWNNKSTGYAKIGGGTINITTFTNDGEVVMHNWGTNGAELTTTDFITMERLVFMAVPLKLQIRFILKLGQRLMF
ncbi:MAG: hypothetical protein R3Y11_05695 [Pseudomonadota bacterium]